MSPTGQTLGCCTNENLEDDHHDCSSCGLTYHLECLAATGLKNTSNLPYNWKCPACTTNKNNKQAKQDSTPIRTSSATRVNKRPALASPESEAAAGSQEIRTIVEQVIQSQFNSMINQLKQSMMDVVSDQLKPLKQSVQEIKNSMEFMNSRFEDIETEQVAAKKAMGDLQVDNTKMKTEIVELNQRINNFEQQVRASNLELQCVPENKQENLISIVCSMASTVGSTLSETNILNCTRIAKLHADSTRPRSIVVQLASPRVRNELLAATVTYNKANPYDKLNSEHLGLPGAKTPVYLVEHLSPANKTLHAATRKKAKEHGYKYVWVRDGRVYARKTDQSEYIYIRNMDSLNKIV
ncbi:uncharacterized protein LOC134660448 [Cydia amplana]|uniref:uncharacterized protein LOC134660448 n=1 Tax=Cydia amplana TaxID=1869771 RepID=UPI002FE5876A